MVWSEPANMYFLSNDIRRTLYLVVYMVVSPLRYCRHGWFHLSAILKGVSQNIDRRSVHNNFDSQTFLTIYVYMYVYTYVCMYIHMHVVYLSNEKERRNYAERILKSVSTLFSDLSAHFTLTDTYNLPLTLLPGSHLLSSLQTYNSL